MSLRKSPTMTPARLAANRRNSRKSTGPRTKRGKAQACMNALKHGYRSAVGLGLWHALYEAPPGRVDAATQAFLTPEQARHPVLADIVEIACQAELGVMEDFRNWGTKKNAFL